MVWNGTEVCHCIFISEWYIHRDHWYGRVYGPNPEPLMCVRVKIGTEQKVNSEVNQNRHLVGLWTWLNTKTESLSGEHTLAFFKISSILSGFAPGHFQKKFKTPPDWYQGSLPLPGVLVH